MRLALYEETIYFIYDEECILDYQNKIKEKINMLDTTKN